MSDDSAQEKTHEPTEKRKQEFAEKGQVARSKEIDSAAGLAVGAIVLYLWLPRIVSKEAELLYLCFSHTETHDLDYSGALNLISYVMDTLITMLAVPMAALWIGAAVIGLGQAKFVIPTKEVLKIEWEKLNPVAAMKEKWFSAQPLVELAKGLLKLFVIGWLVWSAASERIGGLPDLMLQDPWMILHAYMEMAALVILRALPVAAIVAVIDYLYQWYTNHEQMMMTKEELKEEAKQAEGDPHMRQARKQRAREIAMGQMVRNVPKADVVITNPTHYAVALRYRKDEAPAPVVVAKGVDHLALRIRTAALESDIPQIENRTLARALHASAKVGEMIPEDLYAAVAKVLAIIWRRRARRA